MRLYRLDRTDVEAAIAEPVSGESDVRGNVRILDKAREGRRILVVVAGDDPGFVITVFLRS